MKLQNNIMKWDENPPSCSHLAKSNDIQKSTWPFPDLAEMEIQCCMKQWFPWSLIWAYVHHTILSFSKDWPNLLECTCICIKWLIIMPRHHKSLVCQHYSAVPQWWLLKKTFLWYLLVGYVGFQYHAYQCTTVPGSIIVYHSSTTIVCYNHISLGN